MPNYSKKYSEDASAYPTYITGNMEDDIQQMIRTVNDAIAANEVQSTPFVRQTVIVSSSVLSDSTARYALVSIYDDFLLSKGMARRKPGGDQKSREYLPCTITFLDMQEAVRGAYDMSPGDFLAQWQIYERNGKLAPTQMDKMVDKITTEVGLPISKQFETFGSNLEGVREDVSQIAAQMEGVGVNTELLKAIKEMTEKNRIDYERQLEDIKESIRMMDVKDDHEKEMEMMKAANDELNRKNEELLQKIDLISSAFTSSIEEINTKLSEMDAFITDYKKGLFSKDTWKESSRTFLKDMELSLYKAKDAISKS